MPKDKIQSSGETGMGYPTSLALAIRFGCGHGIPGNDGSGMPQTHFPMMFILISEPPGLLVQL